MTRQHVSRTNQQTKSDTPLVSGILQRAAVRNVPEKDVQPTQEEEATTFRESRFHHNFCQVPISRGEMPMIQPKLMIGAVDDRLLQAKSEMTGNSQDSSEVRPNQTGLPNRLKTGIENLSGYSMDDVRVHDNSPKPAQLQALAYTQGTDIHIALGQEEHLPHEAWHVVQQKQGRVKPTLQTKGVDINEDEGLEKEADVMGVKALQMTHTDQLASAKPAPSTSLSDYAAPRIVKSSSSVVQLAKHAKNWTNYVNAYQVQYGLLGAGDPLYDAAIQAATKLDHIGPRAAATNLTEQTDSSKLTWGQKWFPAWATPITAEQKYIQEVQDIQDFLHQAKAKGAGANPSTIKWGGLRNGFGTWVEATLRKDPNLQPTGSSPTPEGKGAFAGTNASWGKLHQRKRDAAGGYTLYARGHLLHDDLRGPGLDYNMTPLTNATGGAYGANNANLAHKEIVESSVVRAYTDMLAGARNITEIYYKVEAKYTGVARRETGQMQTIANAYQTEIATIGGAPTHNLVMNALVANLPGGVNQGELDDAMKSVGATQSAAAALAPGGGGLSAGVLQNLQDNRDLWQFEDENVPDRLDVTYSWVEHGTRKRGREASTGGENKNTIPVKVILPNSLQAKFV
jgi:hypothetical protein